MISDFPYDSAYDPPAPICRVTISSAATDRKIQLQAIVDRGGRCYNRPDKLLARDKCKAHF